ncbi:MAG: B12-binding domain-containing radical SAM protein [Desulfuromonas sp.]|nr:B12-binding domain-containing radical SAM protein [Desulfuromonas sp.]
MYYFIDYEEPVFRPPSEANSLILQATIGCSQNRCRFCGMYKMKKFRLRSLDDLAQDLARLPARYRQKVQRVFLADGDALVYPYEKLLELLVMLQQQLPAFTRVSSYASPRSLTTKSEEELRQLKENKLRILYFGLESGDSETLRRVNKGFDAEQMLELCQKVKRAGLKLSVTAILGLAGRERSTEHALATARWVSALSPEYFSLLTMFRRHNDDYFQSIDPLSHGGILQETLLILEHLAPRRTILRSNHVSNFLNLAGSYPKDRQALIDSARQALTRAKRDPAWFDQVPGYREELF